MDSPFWPQPPPSPEHCHRVRNGEFVPKEGKCVTNHSLPEQSRDGRNQVCPLYKEEAREAWGGMRCGCWAQRSSVYSEFSSDLHTERITAQKTDNPGLDSLGRSRGSSRQSPLTSLGYRWYWKWARPHGGGGVKQEHPFFRLAGRGQSQLPDRWDGSG